MSNADFHIHRMNYTDYYKRNSKREYCINCGKDITDALFSFNFCSDSCQNEYEKSKR
jgi:Uncharacterized protein containing a Zn-ribbon (DUF2116)